MIIDRLEHADFYHGLGPRFRQAFDYLRSTDLLRLPTGRLAIDGDGLFAIVVDGPTRLKKDCRWEAHRRYHDLQYVASGEEVMGFAPREAMRMIEPFADGEDYAFFEGEGQYVRVGPGHFMIFAPQDVHRPSMAVDDTPAPVRKVVLKVLV
jgi:YhcH/YjgK/YiaL family protein